MKKYLALVTFLLLGLGISLNGQQVNAAAYSPSIKITATKLINQQTIPAANLKISITPVSVKILTEKIDLSNPASYQITKRENPLNLLTNQAGVVYLAGVDQLPEGYYEIQEENQQPFLISLPYRDVDGQIKDDWVIQPKPIVVNLASNPPDTSLSNRDNEIMQTSGVVNNDFLIIAVSFLALALTSGLGFALISNRKVTSKIKD